MRPLILKLAGPGRPLRLFGLLITIFCLVLPGGCTTRYVWEQPPPPKPVRETPPPKVQAPQYPVYYVAASRLNLRACPGMDCPKISRLERNQEVEKLDESQDWVQIRSRTDGTVGWVNARYLSQTPVTETPPPAVAAPAPAPSETPAKKPEVAKPVEKPTPSKPPAKKAEEKKEAVPSKKAEERKEVTPRAKKTAPVEEEEEEEAPAVVQKSPPAPEAATTTVKQPVSTGTPPPATSTPATPAEPKAKRVRIM